MVDEPINDLLGDGVALRLRTAAVAVAGISFSLEASSGLQDGEDEDDDDDEEDTTEGESGEMVDWCSLLSAFVLDEAVVVGG